VGEVLQGSLLQLLLGHCDFWNMDISQGSVATRSRCGGIFKYELGANLPVSQPVKEFWKSVNIWGSYGQEFGVLFFLRHSACAWTLGSPLEADSEFGHKTTERVSRAWAMSGAEIGAERAEIEQAERSGERGWADISLLTLRSHAL